MASLELAKPPSVPRQSEVLSAVMLDDSEIDQHFVRRIVEKSDMHMECVFARDAEAFGSELDNGTFDIAFLDYHLVGSTGFDAVRQLRRHDKNRLTPAIMISSDAPAELVVKAMRSGCSGYLSKDNLSEETLGHSVSLALEDLARHQFNGFTENDLRETTQKILDGIQRVSERELRESTKRIVRATRFLRQCQHKGYKADPDTFDILERECGKIADFLDELETHCLSWTNDQPRLQ